MQKETLKAPFLSIREFKQLITAAPKVLPGHLFRSLPQQKTLMKHRQKVPPTVTYPDCVRRLLACVNPQLLPQTLWSILKLHHFPFITHRNITATFTSYPPLCKKDLPENRSLIWTSSKLMLMEMFMLNVIELAKISQTATLHNRNCRYTFKIL